MGKVIRKIIQEIRKYGIKVKIFSIVYSYPDDNRKWQDYVRHFSENVVHPEDNFPPIKIECHRVIVRLELNNLNTSPNLE